MGHDGGRSLAQNEAVVQGILSRRFLATGTTQRGGRRRPPSPLQVDRRGCYSRVLRHIWRAKQGRQPPAVFTEPKTWLEKRRYGAATSELEVGNDGREKWRRGRSSGSFIGASVQAHYEQLPESFLQWNQRSNWSLVRILGNRYKIEFRFVVLTNSVGGALDIGWTQSLGWHDTREQARSGATTPTQTGSSSAEAGVNLPGLALGQAAHGSAYGPLPGCQSMTILSCHRSPKICHKKASNIFR
jgi:hypothetical protein